MPLFYRLSRNLTTLLILTFVIIHLAFTNSYGYTITNLKATYRSGQVFVTWTCPRAKNLQYNVYRSLKKFVKSSQLNDQTFMGFVRDSSSKNLRLSAQEHRDIYFQITDSGAELAPSKGLYVVTCIDTQLYYYAVTVTDLSTGDELKAILPGKNSLSFPVRDLLEQPKPVYQFSELVEQSNDVLARYVQFGNNQETPLYPAMNSTGSYGFNFYITRRGSATSYPLIVYYVGFGADPTGSGGLDQDFTNCYILGVDDWLPIPNGQGGDNTYYCCYHERFNIYSVDNEIPSSGVVKLYPQRRYIQTIRWMKSTFPIDDTRIYTKGTSAGGFGALLTAMLFPSEIAAVYATVEPTYLKPTGNSADLYKEMWGSAGLDLNSDFPDPETQLSIPIYSVLDIENMLSVDDNLAIPMVFDVHGKFDDKIGWSKSSIDWFSQLQNLHVGGVFYWDGRNHNGNGKDFLAEETTPEFFRYQTTKSYPAFANCSINQDPGTGTASSGSPYGAINGYLDWDDNITDNACDYSINVFVKDFYVSGVLDPNQYNTCTTDITFRRLQNFHPNPGDKIKWKNFNSDNHKIGNGSINYNGGLITLEGITINKSGNRIELTISDCEKMNAAISQDPPVYFSKTANGYLANVDATENDNVKLNTFDLLGRLIQTKNISLIPGPNSFEIPAPGQGIYLIEIAGNTLSYSGKLLF